MEFNDTDQINKITLRKFMFGRRYVWVLTYKRELDLFGPRVFRNRVERIQTAVNAFLKNNMRYHLYDYNCEYFVRMCVFNQEALWRSPQTTGVFSSSLFVSIALLGILATHVIDGAANVFDFERDSPDRRDDIRYRVEGDSIIQDPQKIADRG